MSLPALSVARLRTGFPASTERNLKTLSWFPDQAAHSSALWPLGRPVPLQAGPCDVTLSCVTNLSNSSKPRPMRQARSGHRIQQLLPLLVNGHSHCCLLISGTKSTAELIKICLSWRLGSHAAPRLPPHLPHVPARDPVPSQASSCDDHPPRPAGPAGVMDTPGAVPLPSVLRLGARRGWGLGRGTSLL